MKTYCWLGLVLVSACCTGCAGPRGHSVADKRDYVQQMKQETLSELYAQKPEVQSRIASAAGYGVFSNIGFTAIYLGAGNGYGVVVDNQSGAQTYMRMFRGNVGLGLGVKDFRAVFVFNDRPSMERFIHNGWDFSAEGEASAKSGEKGGAAEASGSLPPSVEVFQFTESGISASATLGGTKFWWDSELNE